MSLSENIRKMQDARGESNYRLAKELGVTQTSVANWRDGVTKPLPIYIKLMAEHFGVTVEELCDQHQEIKE